MDALAEWIKEMLKVTGINWKFTEETYKAMFPDMQASSKTRSKLKKMGSGKIKIKDIIFAKYTQISRTSPFKLPWWGISEDFYNSKKGVYTHSSIVPEKTDICPTYNMIKMLKDNFNSDRIEFNLGGPDMLFEKVPKMIGKDLPGNFSFFLNSLQYLFLPK